MDCKRIVFRVDFPIISLNKLLRWHWSTRNKHCHAWQVHIRAEFRGKPPAASGPMRVRITSYRTRLLDMDNLVGGAKPLVDSLKKLGLIVDDTVEQVLVEYEQVKVKKEAKTVVELEAA